MSAQRLLEMRSGALDNEKGPHKIKREITDLQSYKHLRTVDRPSLASLPLSSYFSLLKQATRLGLVGLIGHLIEDILELCPEDQRAPAMREIVSSATLPLAPLPTILLMLQYLRTELDRLPLSTVTVLIRTIADAPPDQADMPLLELVFPLLLARLQTLPQPQGNDILTYTPPKIIAASFSFVDKLLRLSQGERALEIFQFLVRSGKIPSEAVQTIPGLKDFASIVRSSLVRASTHWLWRPLAQTFLSSLLDSPPTPDHPAVSLAIDTIYACLDFPTVADLAACRSLIIQIHPFSPVPNGVVREFYDAAESIKAGPEAHALYLFTRSEEVMQTHKYPCPRGLSLAWLLRHLLEANSHLAKTLGEEILHGSIPIPVESRARLVAGLAESGHATTARGLWSRFAIGKDRETFIQDPACMIRMVSLFHHLIQKAEETLAKRVGKGPFLDDRLIRQQIEDMEGFLKFVLSEFARAHSPLSSAHHRILTSQARAFFIIGEFVKGFETFKILLGRREMPDVFDVNVTLTVMAAHDARMAAQLLDRMKAKGLQPDHISYGTVMHHALIQGDMELVDEMVGRVRELKNMQLSYKSIIALVRGSVALDDVGQQSKLKSVLNIIKSIGRSTVATSPHVGKFLVLAALRAKDPVMAYRFWEFLLKDNADWVDREHQFLRRIIAKDIRTHQKENWVKESVARMILAELQEEIYSYVG